MSWNLLAVLALQEYPVDCTNPSSLWEKYVCELKGGPKLQEQCHPRFVLSERKKPKGLIVGFHGYTACPDSFESLVEVWVAAGFDVILPLVVGHGRDQGDCADASSRVYNDFTVCANGDRIDGLPISRQGYVEFVDRINAIVEQEARRRNIKQVFATGLSQGGPLASYAISSGNGLYNGAILMNSFFGFSSPAADRKFSQCIEESLPTTECIRLFTSSTVDSCDVGSCDVGLVPDGFREYIIDTINEILPNDYNYEDYAVVNAYIRKAMAYLAENFDSLEFTPLKTGIDQKVHGWGEQCEIERGNGRGGICSFRLRNLFATNSFAMYAQQATGLHRSSHARRIQVVSTERDGNARLSFQVQAAQNEIRHGSEQSVSFCTFRIVPGCNLLKSNNTCGVPHSMLSRSEQELAPPFELYWEKGVQGNATRFLETGTRMGTKDDTFSPFTSRDDCVQLSPTITQPLDLVLPPYRGIWIRTTHDDAIGVFSKKQQDQVANLLMDALSVDKGAVVPVAVDIVSGEVLGFDGAVAEFYLEFPSDQVSESDLVRLEEMILRQEFLDKALGTEVKEVEIAGRLPRQAGTKVNKKKTKKEEENEKKTWHAEEKKEL